MTTLPTTCPHCGNDELERDTSVSYHYDFILLHIMVTCWKCRYWWKYEATVDPEWELKRESNDFD